MSLFDLFRSKSKYEEQESDITPTTQEVLQARTLAEEKYEEVRRFIDKYYKPPSAYKERKPDDSGTGGASSSNTVREQEPERDCGVRFSATSAPDKVPAFQSDDLLEDFDSHFFDFAEKLYYSDIEKNPELIRRMMPKSFSEQTKTFMTEKGLTPAEVYKRALLDRSTFSKILSSPGYSPTKDTAIAVCLGLTLNAREARRLLTKAGYTLSASILRDVIVKFCIEKHIYDVVTVNCLLDRFGCRPLGRS